MPTSWGAMSNADRRNFIINMLPLLLLLVPVNEVFTSQMRLFFVVVLIAILAFCLETIPQTVAALMMPVALVFFGVAPAATVLQPYTTYIPWQQLAGLTMAVILERVGFLKRISYMCILATGASYKGVLVGICVAGALITTFAGSMVVPFAALCYGIVKTLGYEMTPAGAGVMLAGSISCLLPTMFKFSSPLMMIGIGQTITGPLPLLGFFETWYYCWPAMVFFVVMTFILTIMFKPEKPLDAKDYFKEQLAACGKMTLDEIKCSIILVVFFLFIIGYKYTPFGLEWGLCLIPLLMGVPVIGCGTPQDMAKVNYGFVFFVGSCMGIGTTATYLGIGNIVGNFMLPLLAGKSFYLYFGMIWVTIFALNFLMTPLAMEAAFTVPFVSIAVELGINPMALYFFLLMNVDQIILPYEYALYMVAFAFGVMRMNDFMKFQAVKTVVATIIMFAIYLPWWNFSGFLWA